MSDTSTVNRRRWGRMATAGLLLAAAGGLGACVSHETALLADDPGFARGYGDGCRTAGELDKSFSTTSFKDDYEFDTSRAYRAGWRQGMAQCRDVVPEAETGGRILGEQSETF